MNERIKELAIQAGFFYEDYKDIWYLEYHNQSCEEEMKKFAELIVRECIDITNDEMDDILDQPVFNPTDEIWNRARVEELGRVVKLIKNRFGVEE